MNDRVTPERMRYDWLLTTFVERTHHVEWATLVSADGLSLGKSVQISDDEADQLAAGFSGLLSITAGISRCCGRGPVRQALIENDEGFLLVMQPNPRLGLAVGTGQEVDLGAVTYEMSVLAEQIGEQVTPAARVGT